MSTSQIFLYASCPLYGVHFTGQNVDLINDRITLKRKERENIEEELAREIRKNVTLSESEIRFFLTRLKKGNINDIKYRKMLITIFVNSIYLFDDNRLTIVFNAGNEPVVVDDVLLAEIVENSGDAAGLYSEGHGSPSSCGENAILPVKPVFSTHSRPSESEIRGPRNFAIRKLFSQTGGSRTHTPTFLHCPPTNLPRKGQRNFMRF